MTFVLLKNVPEKKIIGEELDEGVTYDIVIDINKKDLIIESEGFSIWRRYKTYEELYSGIVELIKDILGDNARIYLGCLPKDALGLSQLSVDSLHLYTIPEKKRIDIIAPNGAEILKKTFNDAESYLKTLEKYAKMLKN